MPAVDVKTVLIVEDADLCASTLEIALASVPGLEVCWAPTAEAALDIFGQRRIDALITDLHLPLMDGFELLEHLRGSGNHARMPIIVISGDTDPRVSRRVKELGAHAFFSKPYSPAEVRRKLEELIHAPQ